MDWKHLAEAISRRDAGAEPPRMGSRRVSARYFRFMSVINNRFRGIHWHRDMNSVSPPKTRRRPIHGGSNPASDHHGRWKCRFCRSKKPAMRDTVFDGDTQSMPLIFVGQQWDGGAVMSMDGRYITRSQGRRCEYARGKINQMKIVNSPLHQPLQTSLSPTRMWNWSP